jgi:uncharacterized membrane protein (UPF0127 family)
MTKYVVAAVIVLAAVVLFFSLYHTPSAMTPTTIHTVTIGTTTVAVEVESTEAAREQGLSGRTSLAEGSGMLFVFQQRGLYGFWMKDMNFALDMIYADAQGRIVTIVQDATPQSYVQNPPQVFYPSAPILYVLEVPAGFAAEHGIQEGAVMEFR